MLKLGGGDRHGVVILALILAVVGTALSRPARSVAASGGTAAGQTAAVSGTRYRGVMSPTHFRAQDFDDLRRWNVNLVRWQIKADPQALAGTVDWTPQLDALALALHAGQRTGIRIVVDLVNPPGAFESDRTMRMFEDAKSRSQFVELWRTIATRFHGHPALYGYDLLNEPTSFHVLGADAHDAIQTQIDAATAIRRIDATTPILFEVDGWDLPAKFRTLQPVPVSNVIYEVHMYEPHAYTHQGVDTNQGGARGMDVSQQIAYPGRIGPRTYDRDALRAILQPVRDFQLAHHARIYCGEFSAVRWAPGADRYLDDVTSIFEDWGWDYSYHAFREWQGWDLEYPDSHDMQKSATPGARERVMLQRFARNRRP